MHKITKLIFVTAFLGLSKTAFANEFDLGKLASDYLAAVEKTNQENVTTADREEVFAFYTNDITYTHVKFQVTIGPKETLWERGGQFMGWNRNGKLEILSMIVGNGMVVVKVKQTGEQKDLEGNWLEIDETTIRILEFERNKIKKITSYL